MELNNIFDFDYALPDELIALEPKNPRSASKLLVYSENTILDTKFHQLCQYLKPNDRLIFNNTKVLNGKLFGIRNRLTTSGSGVAKIEILLNERVSENQWTTLCRPLKKLKVLDKIIFSSSLQAEVLSKSENQCLLSFSKSGYFLDQEILKVGQLPLPPYIIKKRSYRDSDNNDYQSIFAREIGAIASPTASLHFDQSLLEKLSKFGVSSSIITLHVGIGTFLPVKSKKISDHKMHFERGKISARAATEINQTRKAGGRIIAVGTTSLRLIESAAQNNGILESYDEQTDIFIKPGYKFKCTDGLITNFHFPKSTLLMLISAFVGNEERKRIYAHALAHRYRFFSYGDSSLLLPKI
jgi:S-adenosylmethionine:tRNA ribosyltransferase-isomerase